MSLRVNLRQRWKKASAILFAAICTLAAASSVHLLVDHDHWELDASLVAPYQGDAKTDARTFALKFAFPSNAPSQAAHWQVQLRTPAGALVEEWKGKTPVAAGEANVNLAWAGRVGKAADLPEGIYRVTLRAFAVEAPQSAKVLETVSIEATSLEQDYDVIEQSWDIRVGNPPTPAMPAFDAMPTKASLAAAAQRSKTNKGVETKSAPALGSLPYTVYFANLHTQTNHSDGGGAVSTCVSSQGAQTGAFGPDAAFPYGKAAGLDIMMTSEHNHYFDGSSGTNTAANPATVKALYQSGLTTAANFNAANPDFLAVYGMEWGVISNGGHMNIFNSNELLGWELNASGQLLADTLTPKGDYAALYTLMKQRGLIGQFNHPDTTGQFQIGGVSLAYSADGDEVMVLSEILNTSAFSSNTTETETGRSSFEGAFNKLLETGYHVAPASNQDNHCANWGRSYTNRTGILIPTGTALSMTSFVDALKARRVYATMDKNSQLVLTANGNIMGSRITNSGPLNLVANFANTAGRTVSTVEIREGVPRRNGTVTALATTATATITPTVGEHFYYAKVTQDDGKILWSAPIWVTQVAGGGDTTAPTVSATATGTTGTITFDATASDNVAVTRVEFLVDGVLKNTDTAAPYSFAFDSTTVANGTRVLTAKAYDAANNVGTSAAVNFTVNNTVSDTTPPTVSASAVGTSGTITFSATASDNVGVTNVEFLVDGVVKGSDATSPYSLAFDSTTVTNGTHTLTARASDAAGNVTTSTAVSFSVNNVVSTTFTETESNGNPGVANVVAHTYTAITGTMGNTTDKDFFAIALAANERVTLNMTGPTTTDYDLFVVDAADVNLAASEGSTSTESITFTNGATARTVYVKVMSFSGSSTTVPYNITVAYSFPPLQLLANPGFESGRVNWTASSGVITSSNSQAARTGTWKAWLNGNGVANTEFVYQTVTIPAVATSVTLNFWLRVASNETTTTTAFDTLKVQVRNTSNAVLATLATYSNLNKGTTYVQRTLDLAAYKGQTVRLYFEGIEGSSVATSFVIDDVAINVVQ